MDYPLIRAVVFVLGLCAAILIGLGFYKVAEYLHWRGNRGHWQKLVEDREKYVEMGCPKWEYNKYGQLTFAYDPFRGTIGGWLTDVGRMEDYPDLNERDTIAGIKRRKIKDEQRSIGYERFTPPLSGTPGSVVLYASTATGNVWDADERVTVQESRRRTNLVRDDRRGCGFLGALILALLVGYGARERRRRWGALGELYRDGMARSCQDLAARLRREAVDDLLRDLKLIVSLLESGPLSKVALFRDLVRVHSVVADFLHRTAWADAEDARAMAYEANVAAVSEAMFHNSGGAELYLLGWPKTRANAIADPKY